MVMKDPIINTLVKLYNLTHSSIDEVEIWYTFLQILHSWCKYAHFKHAAPILLQILV